MKQHRGRHRAQRIQATTAACARWPVGPIRGSWLVRLAANAISGGFSRCACTFDGGWGARGARRAPGPRSLACSVRLLGRGPRDAAGRGPRPARRDAASASRASAVPSPGSAECVRLPLISNQMPLVAFHACPELGWRHASQLTSSSLPRFRFCDSVCSKRKTCPTKSGGARPATVHHVYSSPVSPLSRIVKLIVRFRERERTHSNIRNAAARD